MTTTRGDQLIEEYLARLADAAAALPSAEREDLVSDIREHITVALDEKVHADEAAVRNLLARLGPPEEVVEAATGGEASPVPSATSSDRFRRGGALEVAAIVTLVLSPAVPGFGWLAGVVLAGASPAWSRHEKLVVAIGIPLPVVASAALLWYPAHSLLDSTFALDLFLILPIGLLLIGPASAAYLAWRLAAASADATGDGPVRSGRLEWTAVAVLLLSWVIPPSGWVAGVVMVVASRGWTRREKLIGVVAIPVATVVAGAVVYLLHLQGVDLALESPVPVPTTPAAVPVLAMAPVAAAYLSWRLIGRILAHRPARPRMEPA